MAAEDARRATGARTGSVLTGPLPVQGRTTDVVLRLGAELEAAWTAIGAPGGARRSQRVELEVVLGDVADAASRAARGGRAQEARRLLAHALAVPVGPASSAAWQQLVATALEAVDAVAWPDDEPWGVLPAEGTDRGTTPSDRPAPPG
ncbi:hypothetical protein [Frigoribacterium salinisoli]